MKNVGLNVRLTEEEKRMLEEKAKQYNFKSVSEYIRFVCLNCNVVVEIR